MYLFGSITLVSLKLIAVCKTWPFVHLQSMHRLRESICIVQFCVYLAYFDLDTLMALPLPIPPIKYSVHIS